MRSYVEVVMRHLGLLIPALLSSLALAYEQPKAELLDLSMNGSGCPIEDSQVTYDFNGEWLTVDFKQDGVFKVQKGRQTRLEASRRNCILTVDLRLPKGYRYAVKRSISSGWLELQGRDVLEHDISFYTQGTGRTTSVGTDEKAYQKREWQFDRSLQAAEKIWSPCGSDRALNVNAQLRVSSSTGNSQDSSDSQAELDHVALQFEVEAC